MNEGYLAAIEQAWLASAGRGLMLSARDLERVRAWSRAGVPAKVVVQGIEAAFENPPEKVFGIDYAAPAVERCIRAWRERKVGGRAEDEATSTTELSEAFAALSQRIVAAGRAQEEPGLREVLRRAWREIQALAERCAADEQIDPVAALEGLAGELLDDALAALPAGERRRIEAEVDAALAEERRFSPPDAFAATRRVHLQRRVRAATGLPELRLRLSRGW